MAWFDFFSRALAGKQTLADVSPRDLEREETRLDREAKRLERELDRLLAREDQCLEQGRAEGPDYRKARYAQKIKLLRQQARQLDRNLNFLRKQQSAVTGLRTLKEQEDFLERSGVSALLADMDLEQVREYVDKATVDGQLKLEKFTGIISLVDGAAAAAGEGEADAELAEIMGELNAGTAAPQAAAPAKTAAPAGKEKADGMVPVEGREADPARPGDPQGDHPGQEACGAAGS